MGTIATDAERAEAARLAEAEAATSHAFRQALNATDNPAGNAIRQKFTVLQEQLRDREANELGIGDLRKARGDARAARKRYPHSAKMTWDDELNRYVLQRCAKSGTILLESDETLEHAESGSEYLCSALGIEPPEVEEEEEAAEPEQEAA